MHVLFINGSPHPRGCTWRAMVEVSKELHAAGITIEWVHVGVQAVRGCMGCMKCREGGINKCIYGDDTVNIALNRMAVCDALVVGSPVHYGGACGAVTSFLDRMFFAGSNAGIFEGKPGAAVVSCRRAGSTSALEQLNKYFTINNMPLVPSYYWNMVHGNTIEEVEQDKEGMFVMRQVGRNLVWLLKALKAGKEQGIVFPAAQPDEIVRTNFIRKTSPDYSFHMPQPETDKYLP